MEAKGNLTENSPLFEKESLFKSLQKDFLYGLFVIAPIAITIWAVVIVINFISGPVSSLFGKKIPDVAAFFITVTLITGIGILARYYFGKSLLKYIDHIMITIPFVNTLYKSVKQLIHALSFENKKNILGAVLIEFPRKGSWAVGFLTQSELKGLYIQDGSDFGQNKCSIFVPTTPNPTTGFFLLVDKSEIIPLGISIEDSVKLIMTAGVLTPDNP